MHFLNVFNVRTDRDFISRLDESNVRNDTHVSHFLNGVGNLSLHGRTEACLESVVEFTSIVEEFNHHWSVLPVDLFLSNSSHIFIANLSSGQRSINKYRRSLLIMLSKVLLLSVNQIVVSKMSFRRKHRVLVSVLLLVFVLDSHHAFVLVSVVSLRLRARQIYTDILAEGFLDDTISSELFSRVDHHLTDSPTSFD